MSEDSSDDPLAPAGTTVSRRAFVRGALVGVAAAAVGCGEAPMDADGGNGTDAAPPSDAGSPPDAGPSDGGPAPDAEPDAAVEPVEPPESVDESSSDFPLGIASGDVDASSAIVWTCYAGSAPLELVVWEMDGEAYARTAYRAEVTPTDGYVHEPATGLRAGRHHRYAFFMLDAGARQLRSPIGRVRTALADGAMETLRIGAVSCTNNRRTPRPLAHAAARDDLDLFLYLGDTTYNDGAESLEEYRDKWGEQMQRDEFRALRASTSALATWDDHEFDNNWDPETFDEAQRQAAVQTFFEHQPVRRDPAHPDRIWKSRRWGQTAELFLLDCRAERRASTRGDTDIYVSREQMDWLKAGLSASTAVFKLIVNSVPIADFPGAFDFARDDRWEGYASQRTEILSHIDDNAITGVLWVAGDFHLASSQRVSRSGPGATQNEILVGPGAQTGNPLAWSLGGSQFDFASTKNNYTMLELLPAMGRIRASWIDDDGSAFEVREYNLT